MPSLPFSLNANSPKLDSIKTPVSVVLLVVIAAEVNLVVVVDVVGVLVVTFKGVTVGLLSLFAEAGDEVEITDNLKSMIESNFDFVVEIVVGFACDVGSSAVVSIGCVKSTIFVATVFDVAIGAFVKEVG